MSSTLLMNQIGNLWIGFLDSSGLPVTPTPTPDSNPIWTPPADGSVATLSAAPDGLSAVLTPVAPGSATVGLALEIGGVMFTATASVTVEPATVSPVASIQIVLTPVPKS